MRPPSSRIFRSVVSCGLLLALVLLGNSFVNYRAVSNRIAVGQLRREMGKQVATLDRQLRSNSVRSPQDLGKAAAKLQTGIYRMAWVEIRSRDGKVLAHAGGKAFGSLSSNEISARMQNREPLFAVRDTASGRVVVEAFPIRLPEPALVELAMSLDAAPGGDWPLRSNLLLNCSGALALLGSVLLISARYRSYLEGKNLERQLEIARQVQQDLLPSETGLPQSVTLSAECLPAWRVGGDFYDLFQTDEGNVALVLGDVSGKGMPAALLMGVMHGAVRSSSWTESARHHELSSSRLNRLLCERSSGARFASMFWACYNPESRYLRYINAGHCAPVLIRRQDGDVRLIPLEEGGPVLGLLPAASYQQATVEIRNGDLLVLYSDGILEAANASGEEFGEERLLNAIRRSANGTPDDIRGEMLQSAREFLREARPEDDLTVMVVQLSPAMAGKAATPLARVA